MVDVVNKVHKKDFLGAHTECLEMIRKNVRDPIPYYALGLIAFEHKNFVKARELFQRAIDLDGAVARYWVALAQLYSVAGKQKQAREAVDQAAALPVEDALTADTIAVIYSRAGFHERAIPFFQKAISYNPEPANFHYNLAASLQFSGRFEEAKKAYKAVISRDENFFKAHSALVSLEKQTEDNHEIPTLERLFEANSENLDARLHYGHALAKSYEDMGDYDESLVWLEKAKERSRKKYPIQKQEIKDLFQAAKASVSVAGPRDQQTSSAAPIFIVGLPRTGTTLVDRILSSHSDVTSAGELNVLAGLVKASAGTGSNMVLDADTLAAVSGQHMKAIAEGYIENTYELARGARRFTDKMPLNFFYGGIIHQALPNAKIVALRRGAMDSCLSNYRQLFSTQFSYYNYTFDLESTAFFYQQFDDLMAYWRAHLPSGSFMEISYEDIVFNQERETRKLLDFCDLEWEEACLHFHENKMPVSTASSVQVRQPLYSGSIGRWKKYGTGLEALKNALAE